MASNKDNQLVEKNDDNFGVENISNNPSIQSEQKLEVTEDEISFKEEDIDNGFACFGFNKLILNSLESKGYKTPTPIQKAAIPELMLGRDLLGQAQTGTGKTAAFALPLIEKLENNKESNAKVLVMTPTRELATQVADSFKSYSAESTNLRTLAIYGGTDFRNQISSLKRKTDIVVGTPGRIMDHIRQGTFKINNISCLVLDEADEMLKMGFLEDIEWIIDKLPENKQMVLFSATMPNEIRNIAKKYLNEPAELSSLERATFSSITGDASSTPSKSFNISNLSGLTTK
jgi:ATP-dependent RNA helicase DeaD